MGIRWERAQKAGKDPSRRTVFLGIQFITLINQHAARNGFKCNALEVEFIDLYLFIYLSIYLFLTWKFFSPK